MDRKFRILVMDDEPVSRELLSDLLQGLGYETEKACTGLEALGALDAQIDLALLDVAMPDMSGFDVCRQIRLDPECAGIPIVMMTTLFADDDRVRALEAGADDFITAPVDKTELRARVQSLLRLRQPSEACTQPAPEPGPTESSRIAELERQLAELTEAHKRTQDAHVETVGRLAVAAEYRDQHTADHIRRVSRYCAILARAAGLPEEEVDLVSQASAMHDVGKIGISDNILLKPGPLTPEQRKTMEQHTVIGAHILGRSDSPVLKAAETVAISHHERWDGLGYPYGLQGEEIPLYGRICAIADVFDALTSTRPYKKAYSCDEAFCILMEGRGTQFDSALLDLFFANVVEVMAVQAEYGEPAADLWMPEAA